MPQSSIRAYFSSRPSSSPSSSSPSVTATTAKTDYDHTAKLSTQDPEWVELTPNDDVHHVHAVGDVDDVDDVDDADDAGDKEEDTLLGLCDEIEHKGPSSTDTSKASIRKLTISIHEGLDQKAIPLIHHELDRMMHKVEKRSTGTVPGYNDDFSRAIQVITEETIALSQLPRWKSDKAICPSVRELMNFLYAHPQCRKFIALFLQSILPPVRKAYSGYSTWGGDLDRLRQAIQEVARDPDAIRLGGVLHERRAAVYQWTHDQRYDCMDPSIAVILACLFLTLEKLRVRGRENLNIQAIELYRTADKTKAPPSLYRQLAKSQAIPASAKFVIISDLSNFARASRTGCLLLRRFMENNLVTFWNLHRTWNVDDVDIVTKSYAAFNNETHAFMQALRSRVQARGIVFFQTNIPTFNISLPIAQSVARSPCTKAFIQKIEAACVEIFNRDDGVVEYLVLLDKLRSTEKLLTNVFIDNLRYYEFIEKYNIVNCWDSREQCRLLITTAEEVRRQLPDHATRTLAAVLDHVLMSRYGVRTSFYMRENALQIVVRNNPAVFSQRSSLRDTGINDTSRPWNFDEYEVAKKLLDEVTAPDNVNNQVMRKTVYRKATISGFCAILCDRLANAKVRSVVHSPGHMKKKFARLVTQPATIQEFAKEAYAYIARRQLECLKNEELLDLGIDMNWGRSARLKRHIHGDEQERIIIRMMLNFIVNLKSYGSDNWFLKSNVITQLLTPGSDIRYVQRAMLTHEILEKFRQRWPQGFQSGQKVTYDIVHTKIDNASKDRKPLRTHGKGGLGWFALHVRKYLLKSLTERRQERSDQGLPAETQDSELDWMETLDWYIDEHGNPITAISQDRTEATTLVDPQAVHLCWKCCGITR